MDLREIIYISTVPAALKYSGANLTHHLVTIRNIFISCKHTFFSLLPILSSSPIISIPVCHHWDHRDLRVRRVPQILEETQTALHLGLLRLLLHSRVPHDHRGTVHYAQHCMCHSAGKAWTPCDSAVGLAETFISACKANLWLSELMLGELNNRMSFSEIYLDSFRVQNPD